MFRSENRSPSFPRCFLGVACALQLSGVDLAATNAVRITTGGCYITVPEPGFADLDTIVTVDNDGAFRTYPLGTETSGSPMAALSICWGHAPTTADNYVRGGHAHAERGTPELNFSD